MRARQSPVEALVTLPRLKNGDERRARWRQAVAALGQGNFEGPPPLDDLTTDALMKAAKVALDTNLLEDLDWISGGPATVALYEITAALPQGNERREFGKRVFSRLYGGTAETVAAVATRMALGSGRPFEAASLRARMSLLFALPIDSTVHTDSLALNLVARPMHFERWVADAARGPLPSRRLAATLLERAAREAVRRAELGDPFLAQMLTAERVRPTYQLLLADREPLVWRHAAIARGLLSAVEPRLREEIDLLLDPGLSPTQWRRAVVSLVACLVSDADTTMRQCRTLLSGEVARRHPAIAATMLWGLPPVVSADPDSAEELLGVLAGFPRRDVAEAFASLLEDVRNPTFGGRSVMKIRAAMAGAADGSDPAMAAILGQIDRTLDRSLRHDETIYNGVTSALVAFETTGAVAAYQIAAEALGRAQGVMNSLDTMVGKGDEALADILPLLHDVDISALERSRLYDLLLLGKRPGDPSVAVPGLESLYDRLGNWVLNAERTYVSEPTASEGSTLARQRKLLVLLHLADVETTKNMEGDELSNRVRKRLRRAIRVLLRQVASGPEPSVHRIMCAALARSFDAAAREQVAETSEVLLLLFRFLKDVHSAQALFEASTNGDLRRGLKAITAFLAGTGDEDDGEEPEESDVDTAERVMRLSHGFGSNGSYRSEALRQGTLRIARALKSIARARGLVEIVDEAAGAQNVLSDLEAAADSFKYMLRSAAQRVLGEEPPEGIDVVADITPLSVLVDRAVTSGEPLDQGELVMASNELVVGLPKPLGRAVEAVLTRLIHLPVAPGSDVSVIPLQNRREVLPDWLLPRRTIGGFYVVRSLGAGGVSSVFAARRIEERRDTAADTYALKVPYYDPNTARSVSEQQFLNMFREEAGALLSLPSHANIARFVTFDAEAKPKPILVMELIAGQPLDRVIRNRSLTTEHALAYLDGVLAGLEAMHGVGVAHLDVKPSNVILRENETPVLVDFGLSGRHLRPGCGTLEYCSPEILGVVPEGYQPQPAAADIYAFACMALEVLTAEMLFDAQEEMAMITQHVSHDGWPDKLAEMAQERELRELCIVFAACLRRDPRQRPSATQTRQALAKAGEGLMSYSWPLPVRPKRTSISA